MGREQTLRQFIGGLTIGLLLFACGSSPSVTERRIDSAALILRGVTEDKDLPIKDANGQYCYSENDTVAIKKYIVTLEQRLKQCQQDCRK